MSLEVNKTFPNGQLERIVKSFLRWHYRSWIRQNHNLQLPLLSNDDNQNSLRNVILSGSCNILVSHCRMGHFRDLTCINPWRAEKKESQRALFEVPVSFSTYAEKVYVLNRRFNFSRVLLHNHHVAKVLTNHKTYLYTGTWAESATKRSISYYNQVNDKITNQPNE